VRVLGATAGMLAVMLVVGARLPAGPASLAATWGAGGLVYLLLLQFVALPGYVGRMLVLLHKAISPGRGITQEEPI
jgi:hypothetical protein